MKDMLTIVHEKLKENPMIIKHCEGRIKYYDYPESGDKKNPFMIITPINPPDEALYGSDKILAYEFWYQIDVQSTDRMICKAVQSAVSEQMRELGLYRQKGGLDQYFSETKRFVDARRYKGKTNIYDIDY